MRARSLRITRWRAIGRSEDRDQGGWQRRAGAAGDARDRHFRGGPAGISQKDYPDLEQFYADVAQAYGDELRSLAAAGCTYVQMDDTNLAYLCDMKMREAARARGDDPNELPHRYATFINRVVAQKPVAEALMSAAVTSGRCDFCRRGRLWCWASSPRSWAPWKRRTRSSDASMKRRSLCRWISSRCHHNAGFRGGWCQIGI